MIRTFAKNRDGNVAMIFGLTMIPMMLGVGALVDYTRAASDRTRIQQVIDSTAVTLAKRSLTLSQSEMQTVGDSLVRSQLQASRPDLAVGTVTVNKGTTAITINVTAGTPAMFGGMFGRSTIDVGSQTQIAWGARNIEVVLALDNTGSMQTQGKISALRAAAKNFVDTLQGVATDANSVKIALVPFDTGVKVGTDFGSANWLTKGLLSWFQQFTWDGCVADRDQSYDVSADGPVAGVLTTLFPAVMCPNDSLAAVMGLTSDFDALRTRIASMTPSGYTNVTVGVAWGMQMLSSNGPFGTAKPFGTADLEKFLIVLTDGDNTENRWTSKVSQIDARTKLACDAAKAKNIKLYTVRVIEGNADLLRNCATTASMFYDVDKASDLDPVFKEIANSIRALRLTQ